MSDEQVPFDEDHAARYDETFRPLAAMKDALHLAVDISFDALPDDARVLVVGAGTGQEILELAKRHPGWRFVGVDPAGAMLARAKDKAEASGILERCVFHEGTLDTLPPGPAFDAATSILVSQFMVEPAARVGFFAEIAARLKPGGVLFDADLSADADPEAQAAALEWWGVGLARGVGAEQVPRFMEAYGTLVALSTAAELEGFVREADFGKPTCIYQLGVVRGWRMNKAQDPRT